MKLGSTWLTRELPVLRAVVAAEEAGDDAQTAARTSVNHLTEHQFMNCLDRLRADGLLDVAVSRDGAGRLVGAHVRRALPKALREVGLWPPTATSVEEKTRRRLAFMGRLYQRTDGDTSATVEISEIASELGWPEGEAYSIARYLGEEGLLRFPSKGTVATTHAGVVEMEAALENPQEPTGHFPALSVVNVYGNVADSQIQAGTEASNQHGAVRSEE